MRRWDGEPVEVRQKRLGTVWIECPYPVITIGLAQVLQADAHVYHETRSLNGIVPDSVILCTNGPSTEELPESMGRIRETNPEATVMVFGIDMDLSLARVSLESGARGFIHAGMPPEQIARALLVASKGEVVAPRELLGYMISGGDRVKLTSLTSRQQEILELVASGLGNAQIAKQLYLSESTVKQHLRAAYKLLGVKNRTEAARLFHETQ
ncbi:MAG: response regulator transcription factor [Rubrobacteraceae bacterium]